MFLTSWTTCSKGLHWQTYVQPVRSMHLLHYDAFVFSYSLFFCAPESHRPFFDFLTHSHSPSFSPSPSSSSLFLLFLCTSNIGAVIHELHQAAYGRVTAKGRGSAVFPAIFKSPWGLRIHGTYRVRFYYIPYVIAGIYTVMFCTVQCDSAERNSCSTSFYEVIWCYLMCESYDMV